MSTTDDQDKAIKVCIQLARRATWGRPPPPWSSTTPGATAFGGVHRHTFFGDEGDNHLGRLLMRVRDELRGEART